MNGTKIRLTIFPTPGKFQILDFFIEGQVIDVSEISHLQLPNEIDFRKGIIINGKGPIWLYTHLVHLVHPAAWVATVDPRLGAVVVQSHSVNGPKVGDVIPMEKFLSYIKTHSKQNTFKQETDEIGKIVALLGPPHSGKSVLMNALRLALLDVMPAEEYQRDFFIIRACPDGEGDWYADIPPEIAKTFRYKHQFDDDFLNSVCSGLVNLRNQKKIILVDCGGKIDKKNQYILNICTHALIVSSDEYLIAEWRGLAGSSELTVLAEIISARYNCSEILNENPLRLRLGKIQYGTRINLPRKLIELLLPENNQGERR